VWVAYSRLRKQLVREARMGEIERPAVTIYDHVFIAGVLTS
jgi:hypothetical protein